MPLKCNRETFACEAAAVRLSAQSAVECRFPGDIVTVLAVSALPVPTACRSDNGEVEYRGRVLLTLVYEDGEKNVCRTERGLEFSHRAEDENCTPSGKASVTLSTLKISARREGAGIYITALIGADITVREERSLTYAVGGEGFIFRADEIKTVCPIFGEGDIETDDEFDTGYVGDVLLHGEKISVASAESEDGAVAVSGEISFSMCVLKNDGSVSSYERLIPFRGEVECEGAAAGLKSDASAFIKSASVSAEADEEKGTCRITVSLTLGVKAAVYSEGALSVITDAFSSENKLEIVRGTMSGEYLADSVHFTERVSSAAFVGTADGGRGITFADSLEAVVLPEVAASAVITDGKEYAEGAVSAKVIIADADGAHRSVDITLPFSVPLSLSVKGRREVAAIACGLAVRQKKEGEIEAEATLKICVKTYVAVSDEYIESVTEGEKLPVKTSAFSVYMASAGEDLWQTAKRLKKSPEEIGRCNPDLKFPLSGNERIIVYRKSE